MKESEEEKGERDRIVPSSSSRNRSELCGNRYAKVEFSEGIHDERLNSVELQLLKMRIRGERLR